ncbi:MAG TPA: immunoglobulin domain-containing protein [Bacteroidia bacterium]|nr:immunoglobulin domain-containing protein [Bacteroidia bacterium]
MPSNFLKLTLCVSFLVGISACSKDDNSSPGNSGNSGTSGCSTPNTPTVSSNSPVALGSNINLSASSTTSSVTYNWTGPNGFTSQVQNPTITNATSADAGKYYCQVSVAGGCTSGKDSTVVQVTTPTAPCNPNNNQYTLVGHPAVNVSPSPLQFGIGISGNYEITCNGSNGDIHFEFAISSKPAPGVYNVTQLGPLAPADEVKISNTTGSAYWTTSGGVLYVTDIGGGKNRYVYCDLNFSNSTFGTSALGSAKITEP